LKLKLTLTTATLVFTLAISTVPAQAHGSGNSTTKTKQIICKVFGKYCSEAISVSSCETGGTFSLYAGEGKHQYLGLFQMGSYARSRYGHGYNAWAQARAAYRYFVDSGRDWSPWSCQPDGSIKQFH
jgi:hypothetical protein